MRKDALDCLYLQSCNTAFLPVFYAEHILKIKKKLNQYLAENTGQPLETIEKDTDRDNWMSAEEAVRYGLIDSVVENRVPAVKE